VLQISTSLGIPDFRSKKSGFYTKLSAMGFEEPEEMFDLQNFDQDPSYSYPIPSCKLQHLTPNSIFYSLAADILPQPDKWTPTHQFIRLLQDRGKLLRNYTQNIDNIESHAGITADKMIQCHGSWAFATCRKCSYKIPGKEIFASVRAKTVAQCNVCKLQLGASTRPGTLKRKRSGTGIQKSKKRGDEDSDSDGQYDIPEPGVMKPDITFFGEHLPHKFFDALQNHDRNKVDLVIVIGTSMKVAPVSEIPQYVDKEIPQIYISLDVSCPYSSPATQNSFTGKVSSRKCTNATPQPIHHIDFDINLIGECDTVVTSLCQRAGWDLEHEMVDHSASISVSLHPHLRHAFIVKAEPSTQPKASTSGLVDLEATCVEKLKD
jgi:NAD+-dependent protein deacetylase SIR2